MKPMVIPAALVATVLLCCLPLESVQARVTVQGTAAQRQKLANWLTTSLGTTVTIAGDGTLSVAVGGNAAATRLRNMVNDTATTVTVEIVEDDPNISIGGWISSDPNDVYGPTSGTTKIDIADLEDFGNVLNSYGFTPDSKIMHEVAETYAGLKNGWRYHRAHAEAGVPAEREVQQENGTDWVGPRYTDAPNGQVQMKIRRPDGSDPPYVIVRFTPYTQPQAATWYKEVVPCDLTSGLIEIADPDPQVWRMEYDMVLGNHAITSRFDTVNSMPTGVAFDNGTDVYVTENQLTLVDEVRKFDNDGNLLHSWIFANPQLSEPQGIDIDRVTGDIFIAYGTVVVRFDSLMQSLGRYWVDTLPIRPTDVAVFRGDRHVEDIPRSHDIYDIFVTDRATGSVIRFDVETDMEAGTATDIFGSGILLEPEGIFVDSWDEIWIASTGNFRIYRFTPLGYLIPGQSADYFVQDTDRQFSDLIAMDYDGVYVLDQTTGLGELLLYDFFGGYVASYGIEELQCPASLDAKFNHDEENLLPLTCCDGDGMRGNADGLTGSGGEVDVADLTYLVAYLFMGGPEPPCIDEGNVDGLVSAGGPIDVADLTYLVAYLFLGGPAPAPCP